MKIPTRIRVGRKKYVIRKVSALSRSRRGHWTSAGVIHVSYRTPFGTPYSSKEQAEAFWHELTHAILHSMGSPLWRSETFVTKFSKKLNNAIHSAEFK